MSNTVPPDWPTIFFDAQSEFDKNARRAVVIAATAIEQLLKPDYDARREKWPMLKAAVDAAWTAGNLTDPAYWGARAAIRTRNQIIHEGANFGSDVCMPATVAYW